MSTVELLVVGQEPIRQEFPEDPTEEELARDWTLSFEDRALIKRCRDPDHKRRLGLQIGALRVRGRFLESYAGVPAAILGHMSQQLGLQGVLLLHLQGRAQDSTEADLRRRAREHLGYASYDTEVEARLEEALLARMRDELVVLDLVSTAECLLREWRVVLPARSTLGRLCGNLGRRGRQGIITEIVQGLAPEVRRVLDELLLVPDKQRSPLATLKDDPAEASPKQILRQLEHHHLLKPIHLAIDLGTIPTSVICSFADLVRRHDAHALGRFDDDKRHALLACFVTDASRTIQDQIISLHDQYLIAVERKARKSFEKTYRESRRSARQGMDTMLEAFGFVLDPSKPDEALRKRLLKEFGEENLRSALESCRHFREIERAGLMDRIKAFYPQLRQYLPTLLALPFEAEAGNEELLEAIALLRKIDANGQREVPSDAPTRILPTKYRRAARRKDGTLDRRIWEMGVAVALKNALRSGDFFLPGSRNYVSFDNLIIREDAWKAQREEGYRILSLSGPEDTLEQLVQEFQDALAAFSDGLVANPFASIEGGRLHLSRDRATEIPSQVHELRRELEAAYPRTRLERILLELESLCGFTRAFQPLDGSPRIEQFEQSLLAGIVAHGTNLGIAAMGRSAEGITVDQLQRITQWYLREDTLKEANSMLVNFLHRLDISSVWGDGTISSSDGQRFGIQPSSHLGGFYPRYFGYYDRALTLYTHVSDEHSTFSTQVISCGTREALHVLDGLLDNNTILEPRDHCTDTHGFTDHIYALCRLLGISFMPRHKDLAGQRFYRPGSVNIPGEVGKLFRGTVDLDLIRQQWDRMVRIAVSLHDRTAPAHVIVQRLSRTTRSDRLAKAFTALGRLLRTTFLLRYVNDPELRRKIRLQLNRGESRHSLARWLFFANYGTFDVKAYAEIMNKASCLSLLSNAVLVWNSIQMSSTVRSLRDAGRQILDEDLARISPLARRHIVPHGTYHFARSALKLGE